MSRKIKFLLNGEEKEVENISPTMTVLEYLRETEQLTGTKEGCAEGDCGACTIALGELVDGKIRYRAVNSCIIFMPKLHGKLVVTVEGVKNKDGSMHPVQEVMYKLHGSQCGFCTPGFIMSLFAYYHQDVTGKENDDKIHEVLAGNLCRCTGYRPIIEAARQTGGKKVDWYSENETVLIEKLKHLHKEDTCSYEYDGQKFITPSTLEDLDKSLAENKDAWLFAGGTDLGLLKTKAHKKLETIIQTTDVPELIEVREDKENIFIGSAVTYTDALDVIEKYWQNYGKLIRRIGSTQIRNLGTIGGNLGNASPIGDSAPCLIALEAKLVLRSQKGERKVNIEDFFLDYRKTALEIGEYIKTIIIPKPKANEIFKVYKLTKRYDQDISAVCGAFKLLVKDNKIEKLSSGWGGMAATPVKAKSLETELQNAVWNEDNAQKASKIIKESFSPLTDFRASAEYRIKTAGNMVLRLFTETTETETLTEVWSL